MVTSQQDKITWEVELDGKEENTNLYTIDTSIDVITQEKVIKRAWLTSLRYHIEQICVLTVYITDDTYGFFNLLKVWLLRKALKGSCENAHDLWF